MLKIMPFGIGHNPYFTGNSFTTTIARTMFHCSNRSQSLFYWKLFYNHAPRWGGWGRNCVTILILLETLLQQDYPNIDICAYLKSQSLFYWKLFYNDTNCKLCQIFFDVTILILLETLLQLKKSSKMENILYRHNPYFTGNSFTTKRTQILSTMWYTSQSLFYWKLFYNTIIWCCN